MFQSHEQTTVREIGAEGCYLLTVKRFGELETGLEVNPVLVYALGVEKGWVRKDCLMLNAEAVLSWITGKAWSKEKTKPGDIAPRRHPAGTIVYIAGEFIKKSPSKVSTHFVQVVEDPLGGWVIGYNPLDMDMTGWTLNSLRIFTRSSNG